MLEDRKYQKRIHDKALDYLNINNNGNKTLLIESPTGSGKTIMGLKIAKFLSDKGHKIGWVAHRRELLNQAETANHHYFNIEDIKFISLFTKNPHQYNDRTVTIVDESQHDAATSAVILHDIIKPKIIIGLTATPYRTDKAALCFQKILKDAGIHQLIREGYLAEYNQFIYNNDWTPYNIAKLYLTDPDRWGKSVIYFLTIDDAVKCAEYLNNNGIASEAVIGSQPRDSILNDFENNRLKVLTNVAVLTEGFDCPSLKTVFVRPASKGPTVQMCGRVLRKYEGLPIVNIVQNVSTKYPFTKHASPYNQYVYENDKWISVDAKNLNPVFIEQRKKITATPICIPPYLINKNKNNRIFNNNIEEFNL